MWLTSMKKLFPSLGSQSGLTQEVHQFEPWVTQVDIGMMALKNSEAIAPSV